MTGQSGFSARFSGLLRTICSDVRCGTGIVSAVTTTSEGLLRLDMQCDPGPASPRSLRYSAHPTLADDSAMVELAGQCEAEAWQVKWNRLPHTPVVSLGLKTDATATPLVGPSPRLRSGPRADQFSSTGASSAVTSTVDPPSATCRFAMRPAAARSAAARVMRAA